jgi:5-methylcytosine-specific restriction endonuclease McrA
VNMLHLPNGIIEHKFINTVPATLDASGYVISAHCIGVASMFNILSPKKQCTKCGERKAKDQFNKDKNRKDGLFPWCKTCSRANTKKHTEQHVEEYRERARVWAENNREKSRAKTREWYRNNKAKALEYAYTYVENRRARKLQNGGRVTEKQWRELKEKYGNKCIAPGCSRTDVTMDHVVPLSRGGKHSIENIQPLCKFHNYSKQTKVIDYR